MNPFPANPGVGSIIGSAVCLESSTGPLAAGQPGSVLSLNDLRNPLSVPMLVDEIVFNIDNGNFNDGGDVCVQLRLGTDPITEAFTPIWLLGAMRNQSTIGSVSSFAYGSAVGGYDSGGFQMNSNLFSMRLSSELILYPGEYVEPIFFNFGLMDTASSYTIRVIVKGRAMPAGAKRSSLPYVSYFKGKLQACNANYTEETKESDLSNPFGTPLYVDRFLGVIAGKGQGQTPPNPGSTAIAFPQPTPTATAIDAALNYITLRAADQSGRPMVRDLTPFGHLFQMQNFAWEILATLPANGFFKFYLNENYANIPYASVFLQAFIGLVGKRLVSQ